MYCDEERILYIMLSREHCRYSILYHTRIPFIKCCVFGTIVFVYSIYFLCYVYVVLLLFCFGFVSKINVLNIMHKLLLYNIINEICCYVSRVLTTVFDGNDTWIQMGAMCFYTNDTTNSFVYSNVHFSSAFAGRLISDQV